MGQRVYYGEKLAIVHIVVLFCGVEGLRVVFNCLKFVPIVSLV